MKRRFKPPRIYGVPLHPVAVHYPIAAWTAATGLAVASLIMDSSELSKYSQICNMTGILTAMVAITFGLLEAAGIPDRTELKATVTQHGVLAGTTWLFYLAMLVLQTAHTEILAVLSGLVGFIFMIMTGHLGGHIVYEEGYPGPDDI